MSGVAATVRTRERRHQSSRASGLLFILPGLVAIMALSWLYVLWGNAGPGAALFFGLKAAVLAMSSKRSSASGAERLGIQPGWPSPGQPLRRSSC